MAAISQLNSLRARLSRESEILCDPTASSFMQYAKRWSDVGRKTPGAIVLPISEEDIREVVKWALETATPFAAKCGGHGLWSTINRHGIVVDLSRVSGIQIDVEKHEATLKGAILTKEVALALAKVGKCAALGNSNHVGAIPYFLGGGAPTAAFCTGFGADNILAARMITAQGDLVHVDEQNHPDLLWALRGAGLYFGIITELTIRIHSLSVLGTQDGTVSTYLAVFPFETAKDVCITMKAVLENDQIPATGMIMAMAPPPARTPALAVSINFFGDPLEAERVFTVASSLNPIFETKSAVHIQNINDALEPQDVQGDYKDIKIIGLHEFEIDSFLQTVNIWRELIEECPDAIETFFGFRWESKAAAVPPFASAMSLRDIRYWQLNLLKCTRSENFPIVDAACEKSFAAQRSTGNKNSKDFVDFVPGNRSGPIEHRFRGAERLELLKTLKRQWDPLGVFTTQLL